MFLDYLNAEGLGYATDPQNGEQLSVLQWLHRRVVSGADGPSLSVLTNLGGISRDNIMNFEPNYLAAIYATYPEYVIVARADYRKSLAEVYGDDPAQIYEYLSQLDLFLGETE